VVGGGAADTDPVIMCLQLVGSNGDIVCLLRVFVSDMEWYQLCTCYNIIHGCFFQVELEDALSCDDEVLEEVFQQVDPPSNAVIRVPQLFVAKLRYYIGSFLHLVYDYGIPVFYWAHHQFADAVRKRYLLR